MEYELLPDLDIRLYTIADDRLLEKPALRMHMTGSFRKIAESVVTSDLQRSRYLSLRRLTPWVWLLENRAYPVGIFVSEAADFHSVRGALREAGIPAEFCEPVLTV